MLNIYKKVLTVTVGISLISGCQNVVPSVSTDTQTVSSLSAPQTATTPTPTATVLIDNPTDPVSPSPTPSVTVSATPSSTPSASPSPTPSVTPSATPSASPSPQPSASPSPYAFAGGSGVQNDPYVLATLTDVQNIGGAASAYFSVSQDIDMSGVNFQPLPAFSGVIYGNNKHLYNLTMTTTGAIKAALFSSMSGTIVNLMLQNVNISAATYATGFTASLTGLISSCGVSGTITSPSGGNGFNTGTGNSVYVLKSGPGSVINTTQAVQFNGNTVNYKFP